MNGEGLDRCGSRWPIRNSGPRGAKPLSLVSPTHKTPPSRMSDAKVNRDRPDRHGNCCTRTLFGVVLPTFTPHPHPGSQAGDSLSPGSCPGQAGEGSPVIRAIVVSGRYWGSCCRRSRVWDPGHYPFPCTSPGRSGSEGRQPLRPSPFRTRERAPLVHAGSRHGVPLELSGPCEEDPLRRVPDPLAPTIPLR